MRRPDGPPSWEALSQQLQNDRAARARVDSYLAAHPPGTAEPDRYWHWNTLRHLEPPAGLSLEEWWFCVKWMRRYTRLPLPLRNTSGGTFHMTMPQSLQRMLPEVDRRAAGSIEMPAGVMTREQSERYVRSALIEEAIHSSQLEGAATTRRVAKEMLRTGRQPRTPDEQMIVNNLQAMRFIRENQDAPLTPDTVLALHEVVTTDTLDDPADVGRFRRKEDDVVVQDRSGAWVAHVPPPAGELPERIEEMCHFANVDTPDYFVHPAVRAVLLHFWLAYDHPFVDGNGRTARALFYWCMLKSGYWFTEWVSISTIVKQAPARYARSFLYSETDDSDATYFVLNQMEVLLRATRAAHEYVGAKAAEYAGTRRFLQDLTTVNHRQVELISHAVRHPGARYTVSEHARVHGVTRPTARADLDRLCALELLTRTMVGRRALYYARHDVEKRALALANDAGHSN